MKIEKKIVEVPHRRVIKPASYQDQPTGDVRERTVIKENGDRVIEQIPITQRVFFEAVVEETILQQERFVVKTRAFAHPGETIKSKGGVLVDQIEEEHHFANEEDAKRFVADSAKNPGFRGIITTRTLPNGKTEIVQDRNK